MIYFNQKQQKQILVKMLMIYQINQVLIFKIINNQIKNYKIKHKLYKKY
jgi:hypothetical protein